MSGGFFRGTSADQDTRFSNKQAKLLKSQKFPPELDHLVDMSKVKMDVIRPWIATRATELLGFEDEVLINFVYGLLDVKVVDGKKIQIQLTGFMEKNTSKFMKELWTLLLSAQNNVSGVPQQFLDAKEEEQRKKKEENDKISQEIQKRRERAGRELEREKHARMEDEDVDPKSHKSGTDMLSRPRDSSDQADEMKPEDVNYSHKIRNGHSISPFKTNTSPLSQRSSPSDARSSSKSGHSYGSYLKEGHKSRSPSVYSQSPRHSISPRRRNHSPVRRSLTPVREYRSPHRHPTSHSPIRRRSPHPRRRSISRSWNRNSSPHWRRSHARRRSPFSHRRSISPLRRRSPSPVRRRSPPLRRRSPSSVHRRSHSPARHRSPIQTQRRSPSPFHRSSHIRHGSPSPAKYESISPIRRSPLPLSSKYRKQSPQSPVRRHAYSYNSPRQRNRSPSPQRSLSPLNRRSSLKVHNNFVDRGKSGRSYDERKESRMPVHQMAVKGPDSYVNSDKSLNNSKFGTRKMIGLRKLSRSLSSSRSPVQKGGSTSHHESSEASREEEIIPHGRDIVHHKNDLSLKPSTYLHPDRETSYANDNNVDILSPDRSIVTQFPTRHPVKSEIQRNDMGDRQKGKAQNALQLPEDIEYGPGGARGGRNMFDDVKLISGNKSPGGSGYKEHALRRDDTLNLISNLQSISKGTEQEESRHEREHGKRSKRKLDKDHIHSNYSDSDNPQNLAKKQLKRSDSAKRDISESSETDSQVDDKEAKRKRKEDKRLRKEEKRRRREERRRRRSERRAAKQKLKTTDALSPPSDFEKHLSEADGSDGDAYQRKNSFKINAKEAESEQKRLEIELRMKALESLRAKKAIND